jgi:hypothetical protein
MVSFLGFPCNTRGVIKPLLFHRRTTSKFYARGDKGAAGYKIILERIFLAGICKGIDRFPGWYK